jgi:hypothetical protein
LALNPTTVDWVLLELRTGTGAETKIATRAAFVQNTGAVVDTDGTSPVAFGGVAAGSYYIVIRHRNHLAIMSAAAVALSASSASYDFTTGATQAYGGTAGVKDLGLSVWGMIAGDIDGNGGIGGTDISAARAAVGLVAYGASDVDMNSGVGGTDISLVRSHVGFTTQVP